MALGRIEVEWQTFKALVVDGVNPSEIQIKETRKAFYAGAEAYRRIVLNSLSAGPEPKPEDEYMMEELAQELKQFAKDVIAGRK